MKISGTSSAAALPALAVKQLTFFIAELLKRAYSTTCVVLRDASWEALMLFTTLVLGPRRPSASSSSFKTKISARLDLCNRGKVD
jgi:hypothetical protein